MKMMKKLYLGFLVLAIFLIFYSVIGTLEIKQLQKELALTNEQIHNNSQRLKELKALYDDLQDYTEAVSANIHDLRFRLDMTIPIE